MLIMFQIRKQTDKLKDMQIICKFSPDHSSIRYYNTNDNNHEFQFTLGINHNNSTHNPGSLKVPNKINQHRYSIHSRTHTITNTLYLHTKGLMFTN